MCIRDYIFCHQPPRIRRIELGMAPLPYPGGVGGEIVGVVAVRGGSVALGSDSRCPEAMPVEPSMEGHLDAIYARTLAMDRPEIDYLVN